MPNVQYQFRNIGLNLPPDLGAWLDAYRANRLPIAMEEWKLKVEQAIADGADLLVIGRPITGATDPGVAAAAIAQGLTGARS